ncbi:MAG: methylornithine synthase PylB [Bacillota bacterium]|nr:methylornithine synthase PylB [Bacillota bacterium]
MPANTIIEKALTKEVLNKEEVMELLSLTAPEDTEALFKAAREARAKYFGNGIFLYGFVYFSTYCRNNCNFCFFRSGNKDTIRYRKEEDEVREIAKGLAESGVLLIDLTMGEDPEYHKEDFSTVVSLVKTIKEDTGLPVMVSPGVVKDEIIEEFAKSGVDFYALYQETYNRELFKNLRIYQDYDERMHAKEYARSLGMHIEEGLMTGLGETVDDLAQAILDMGSLKASQIRVMTFVPQEGTPMEAMESQNHDMELKIIAVMRLLYPRVLIPASLDVEGLDGLESRIMAGCNVVTSIIPPAAGLAGVAQSTMDVNEGKRTVAGVLPRLEKIGMRGATVDEYKKWLADNI